MLIRITTQFLKHGTEKTKSALEESNVRILNTMSDNVGGAVGAFFHDLWMNPADVLKE